MSRRNSFLQISLSISLLAVLLVPSVYSQENRIALITEVQGTVEVAREGSTDFEKAEWGSPLFEGDQVRTGDASEAVVLFSSNNMLTVREGNTFTVSSGSVSTGSLSGPVRAVEGDLMAAASDLTLHRAGEGEIAVLGGLRSGGSDSAVELQSPLNTRITEGQPRFSWTVYDEFEFYTVSVRSSGGEVWSTTTEEMTITYPADAPSLAPGQEYFWQVTAEGMLDESVSSLARFVILSESEIAAVQSGRAQIASMFEGRGDSSAMQFMIGSMLIKSGLLADALEMFKEIAETHPSASMTYEIMGKLYYEMGMKDKAVQALQTAIALH